MLITYTLYISIHRCSLMFSSPISLLEIKCPFSVKDNLPSSSVAYIEDGFTLSKKHNYYKVRCQFWSGLIVTLFAGLLLTFLLKDFL